MMLNGIGSLSDYTKNLRLKARWDLKKSTGNVRAHLKTTDQWLLTGMDPEEEDGDEFQEIMEKVLSGKKLTAREKQILQARDPATYQRLQSIEEDQKSYERELRRCRTKEEVQRLRMSRLNASLTTVQSVRSNPHIPEEEKQILCRLEQIRCEKLESSTRTFVRRGEYSRLPTEAEEAEAERQKKQERRDRQEAQRTEERGREEQLREREEQTPDYQKRAQGGQEQTAERQEGQPERTEVQKRGRREVRTAAEAAAQRPLISLETPEQRKVRRARARAAYAPAYAEAEEVPALELKA